MEDTKKTKAQLIAELKKLRRKNSELKKTSINYENAAESKTKYNELIQSIVINSEDIIAVQDAEGEYVFYNSPPQYGINSEIAIGKKPHDLFDSDLANQYMENFKKVIESGNSITLESQVQWLGKIFWFSEQLTPIKNSSGEVKSVVTVSRDITERKQAEELLRAASLYSRSLIETSLDSMVTIKADGRITDVNIATERITGFSREKLIGSDFADYFTDPEKARTGYRRVFEQGKVIDYPLAVRHTSGVITDVLYNASVYRDERGEILGVFATARDITERKRAEEKLLLHSTIIENMSEGAHLCSLSDGKIIYTNLSFEKMFGYEPGELIGKHVTILNDPSEVSAEKTAQGIFNSLNRTGRWSGEVMNIKKDDTRFICYANCFAFEHPGYGKVSIAVHTDITESKNTEKLLKASEAELKKDKLALEQKSIALREVISEIEEEKNMIKDDITTNIKEVLLPILEKLKLQVNSEYIKLLRHHLEKIVSTFGRKITTQNVNLTPREIEICTMVESGLNNKEISKLLGISCRTVEKHRNRIRDKFNITNKNINLSTFLQQL